MLLDINHYVTQCAPNIAQVTMMAIVKTESNNQYLAINLNGGLRLRLMPNSYTQAESWVNYLEKNNYNFDVGLAQINIKNIHKYGYHAYEVLEPCTNLQIAAKILSNNYNRAQASSLTNQEALKKAISAYNTGNYRSGFSNGYVAKVTKNAQQILSIND